MKKVKVYIGCALTHAPMTYKRQISDFKIALQAVPWIEVLEFVSSLGVKAEPHKDPLHIYTNDIHGCVGTAQVIIGELSYPSTGLGWELGTAAEHHGIRVMMCAKEGRDVSYLPRGAAMHKNNAHLTFHWYKKSPLELLPYFLAEIGKINER